MASSCLTGCLTGCPLLVDFAGLEATGGNKLPWSALKESLLGDMAGRLKQVLKGRGCSFWGTRPHGLASTCDDCLLLDRAWGSGDSVSDSALIV